MSDHVRFVVAVCVFGGGALFGLLLPLGSELYTRWQARRARRVMHAAE
jgi:hypothetical protein